MTQVKEVANIMTPKNNTVKKENYVYVHESDYKEKKSSIGWGISFSHIISLLGLLLIMIAAWVSLNVRIAEMDVKYSERTDYLEKGRVQNAKTIQDDRTETKEALGKISDKIDVLISKSNR